MASEVVNNNIDDSENKQWDVMLCYDMPCSVML